MASPASIQELRDLIAEPDDTNGWTDERLGEILDARDEDVRASAGHVWTVKASTYASLVDVSESGSSRKLSDLHRNALVMAGMFEETSTETNVARRPRISQIVRP